jgi:hypothetical protein
MCQWLLLLLLLLLSLLHGDASLHVSSMAAAHLAHLAHMHSPRHRVRCAVSAHMSQGIAHCAFAGHNTVTRKHRHKGVPRCMYMYPTRADTACAVLCILHAQPPDPSHVAGHCTLHNRQLVLHKVILHMMTPCTDQH